MHMIAAFFGPYASDALPSHVSVFSHDFKRFERLTKLATSSVFALISRPMGSVRPLLRKLGLSVRAKQQHKCHYG
jgi:hypothetical protein